MSKVVFLFIATVFSLSSAQAKLSESIPHPFHDVQKVTEGKQNYLTVLNSGVASLQARIDMIRSAKKTIEVEYFIYALDSLVK